MYDVEVIAVAPISDVAFGNSFLDGTARLVIVRTIIVLALAKQGVDFGEV